MAMTPDEIRAKSFPKVKKGGADVAVVDAFLTEVADEISRLQGEADAARDELARSVAARPEPEGFAPTKATIAVVGSHVDELLEAAQRSADAIVRDAGQWASSHKTEADTYAQQVRSQVDQLRQTTEQQAENFREETVQYATKIREDAEETAKAALEHAEADASAQYEARNEAMAERWEAVKSAERSLLATLAHTTEDFSRAQNRFEETVSSHDIDAIEPTNEIVVEVQEPLIVESTEMTAPAEAAPADPTGVDDEVEADPDVSIEDDVDTDESVVGLYDAADEGSGQSTVEEARGWDDAEEPGTPDNWASDTTQPGEPSEDSTPTGWETDTDNESGNDLVNSTEAGDDDLWADDATDSDEFWGADDGSPSESWESEPATSAQEGESADNGNQVADAWASPDADTAAWGSGSDDHEPSGNEDIAASTAASWAPGPAPEPWAPEVAASTSASLVTSAEVTQPATDDAFFDSSPADGEADTDPLAAMVREAVDRVTDGDGAN